MIDSTDINAAMAGGLAYVCAMCQHYWTNGDGEYRCHVGKPCGSPLAGDTFSEYIGPIEDFTNNCFVCGEKAVSIIQVNGSVRMIGVCAAHLKWVGKRVPNERPATLNNRAGLIGG